MADFGAVARRAHAKIEERVTFARLALRSGNWPAWETSDELPTERRGWLGQVTEIYHNKIFCVLVRKIDVDGIGIVSHGAISNVFNDDISWRDKQRIKNELFGQDRVAVEVFPRADQLVDGANMFHFWVYPEGYELPFGLHL